MRNITALTLLASIVLLQACSSTRVAITTPESLIDKSSERVTFSLASPSARQDIADWLAKDVPSRVELDCGGDASLCSVITQEFDNRAIPVQLGAAGGQPKAVLVYDRFVARACNNQFRDNSFNPNNQNQSALGCSVSTNMVQSVADSSQFTSPPLMGSPSAIPAVKAVQKIQR